MIFSETSKDDQRPLENILHFSSFFNEQITVCDQPANRMFSWINLYLNVKNYNYKQS